jgi:hypothetical protein
MSTPPGKKRIAGRHNPPCECRPNASGLTLEAGIHGWTPFVPGRTGWTRTRAGGALVPYGCAGAPAIDYAGAAARTVAARPASIGRAYLANADGHGKTNEDQCVPHDVHLHVYSLGGPRSEVLFSAARCNRTLPRFNVRNPPEVPGSPMRHLADRCDTTALTTCSGRRPLV